MTVQRNVIVANPEKCPKCGTTMQLTVIESGNPNSYSHFVTCEERWDCPKCKHTISYYPY